MEVIEAIQTRRSIRKYKKGMIPDEDLKKILTAAQLAPSAGNKQPWRFVVVREPEKINELAKIANNQMWIADASVVIAALAMDKGSPEIYPKWVERDVMIAVEHMVLAAWSLGYGSCWVGAFSEEKVKEFLGIPENMTVIVLLPIGIPDHKPEARPRKPLSEIFSSEKYGQTLKI
ncbi:nitroreductase family protein [Candidatus Bathyarchaeota archaeon]|nr:nitroreductase family protein [Candidatus Bathyarchaeota archaeon]MBS7630582.1 nitroreductase family protein [Candidatus Bathyarchaeota archaeon]